ncbi:hypothetical protein J6590_067913 [Homalodisca vitripennis]|nr:hypothetical protein J6590_067913 [Homalodisca vitripennis]
MRWGSDKRTVVKKCLRFINTNGGSASSEFVRHRSWGNAALQIFAGTDTFQWNRLTCGAISNVSFFQQSRNSSHRFYLQPGARIGRFVHSVLFPPRPPPELPNSPPARSDEIDYSPRSARRAAHAE